MRTNAERVVYALRHARSTPQNLSELSMIFRRYSLEKTNGNTGKQDDSRAGKRVGLVKLDNSFADLSAS
jgi:hypothetical protein